MKTTTAIDTRLAIDGGTATRTSPLPKWPVFSEDEIDVVRKVLDSGRVNYWTGDEGRHFEREFADFHGVEHGVAVANGTVALELALRALGVGDGDEVVVTPRSFFASASAIAMVGAKPVFADVSDQSQNITAESVRAALTEGTKAILAVHLAGWPCDMDELKALASEKGIALIEDCAQAHGARIGGRLVGSFGDAAAFSFCQDKIMTTGGEGGILLCNDEATWKKAWSFKDHGKDPRLTDSPHSGIGFRWLHRSVGTNWRLTEMQAALGRYQLKRLEDTVQTRRNNAMFLVDRLRNIRGLRVPLPEADIEHAFYRLYVFVERAALKSGWDRDRILASLSAEGVPAWSGSCPEIYREDAFAPLNQVPLPIAKELGETSLALPIHPTLSEQDLSDIADAYQKVFAAAA